MNDRVVQPAAVEPSPLRARPPSWEAFERALAAALSVLEDEYLVVSARKGHAYVQFHVSPDVGVLAETASNAYRAPDDQLDAGQLATLLSLGWAPPTRPPDAQPPVPKGSPNHFRTFPRPFSCAEIARFAVATLAGPLHVKSPGDLAYKAFDEAGHPITLPALPIERRSPPPARAKAPARPRRPGAFDRLRASVLAAARAATGQGSLAYDDGTLQVPVGNRTGFIRPTEDPFYVRVHVHLLSDVEGTEDFLARAHDLNRRLPVVRVIYHERSVFLGVDFPALPFRPEHLVQATSLLARLADEVLEDLRAPGGTPEMTN